MKCYLLLVIVALCLNIQLSAHRAIVTGHVSGTKTSTLETTYYPDLLNAQEKKQVFGIDKKGNFRLVFDLEHIQKIYLTIDKQQAGFYLEPGDSLTLNVDYSDFDKSLAFGGVNSEKNKLLKAFEQKFVAGHEQDLFMQNAKRNAAGFSAYCDSLLGTELAFVQQYSNKPSPAALNYFVLGLKVKNMTSKLEYAGLWRYLNRKGDTLPDIPANYDDFIKVFDRNNDSLLLSGEYFRCVDEIVSHYTNRVAQSSGARITAAYGVQTAELLFANRNIIEAYKARQVCSWLQYQDFNEAEKTYKDYLLQNSNSAYAPILLSVYEKIRAISPGQPAPALNARDAEGKPFTLGDLKGKVVYIDFWASWCGPCIMELPYADRLKKEFAGKDVVFLYVSLDEDVKSWKNAIAKHAITGIHINIPGWDNPLAKAYHITGVPTYFLLDRNGIIVTNQPGRPSDHEQVVRQITEALQR